MPLWFRFLLIGSAPYITDWMQYTGRRMVRDGWILCALNNAWSVSPDRIALWFHSTDFELLGHVKPDRAKWDAMETDTREFGNTISDKKYIPYAYTPTGSGTMLLNALVTLVNIAQRKGARARIAVAGCDMAYDENRTHFYGQGTPDPLRYGPEWIVQECVKLKRWCEDNGFLILNYGGQEKTLLPFERGVIA